MTISERCNEDFMFILLALLIAALLGFLIGWLLRSARIKAMQTALDACNNLNKKLESDNSNSGNIKTSASAMYASAGIASVAFDGDKAKLAFGKKIKQDDLTVVEGIGPKISQLLNNDGITTWSKLSNTDANHISNLLNAAGPQFAIHKPKTWPEQAEMAANGKWAELKKWQDELDGGK